MLTDTNKDYRNTTNCPVLVDVALKKCALERKIQQDHKRAKIMYNFVHDKQDVYFKPFKMSILSHFLKYITANVLIVVLGLESLIYGYLKLTILFVKMLFQKIQQVEVKPVK